jgi:hypothetical protein
MTKINVFVNLSMVNLIITPLSPLKGEMTNNSTGNLINTLQNDESTFIKKIYSVGSIYVRNCEMLMVEGVY